MKVYVVLIDDYEAGGIAGIYATPDAAMAAHPAEWEEDRGYWHGKRPKVVLLGRLNIAYRPPPVCIEEFEVEGL